MPMLQMQLCRGNCLVLGAIDQQTTFGQAAHNLVTVSRNEYGQFHAKHSDRCRWLLYVEFGRKGFD
jgi:hypothetical protein